MRLVVGDSGHGVTPLSNRKFGLFFSLVLTLLALFSAFKSLIALAAALQFVALILVFVSFKADARLRILNLGWVKFGLFLGKITNPLILTFIFFFIVVPYATIGRVLRRDALQLRAANQRDSYWTIRDRETYNIDWLKRQF